MDNIIGTLVYKITGDATLLNKELLKSKNVLKQTSLGFEDLSKKALQFGSKVLTGVIIKALADAASRLEELDAKFNTVFKGIESETDAWVEKYADDTNRGILATKEFMATQQDLRTGYGDTTKSAAEYSKAVVGITNDLASFSNIRIEDAMQNMQSGLNGQFVALRRLGVQVSVESINQGNYSKILNKTYEQMTAMEKQEAILTEVVSQSKNALHQTINDWRDYNYELGDATKTSDSYINTLQGFNQTLDDTKAVLGDFLLPSLTAGLAVGKDFLDFINSLPAPLKAAATTTLALGAALKILGTGPIGLVLSGVAALTVLTTGLASQESKLQTATKTLSKTTVEYNLAVKALEGDTSKLSAQEITLYENRKKLAELKAKETIDELASGYNKEIKSIESTIQEYEKFEAAYLAYTLALEAGSEKVSEARIKETIKAEWSTDTIKSFYEDLEKSEVESQANRLESQIYFANESIKIEKSLRTSQVDLQEQILSTARSVQSGIVDISYLEATNKDLYDSIMECVAGYQEAESSIGSQTEATEKAIKAGKEWSTQLRQQRADQEELDKEYRKAASTRILLLMDEEKEEKRLLASKLGLIAEEEDITSLSISEIEKRIKTVEGGNNELIALETYFANERNAIWKEAEDKLTEIEDDLIQKRKDSANEIQALLDNQTKAEKEKTASELESWGRYEEAYEIRIELLKDEGKAQEEALQERIDKEEATADDLANLQAYYANEEVRLNNEKNQKIIDANNEMADESLKELERIEKAQKQNAKEILTLLENQIKAGKERVAAELETEGFYEAAYVKRIELLREEAYAEAQTLQEKIDLNEATAEDMSNLWEYYNKEEIALNDEKNKKIEEANKKARDKEKEGLKQVLESLQGNITSFYGSIVTLAGHNTERRIEEINKQTEAELKALGLAEKSQKEKLQTEAEEARKNGDMELAQEKMRAIQKLEIEEESADQIKKLQREQAEREKNQAVFTATLDMLSSVIKFLATPGGWPGVALSAMAAATGAAQIAAIQAQPLPSYDVGALNISEDHIANVHQGEMIIPKSFAESLRQGDLSISGGESKANVQITIINNSSSSVETERSEEDGIEKYTVIVGKVVDKQFNEGRYDNTLQNRYGIKKRGL